MSEKQKDQLNKLEKYYNLRLALENVVDLFASDSETFKNYSVSDFMKKLADMVFDGETNIFENKLKIFYRS